MNVEEGLEDKILWESACKTDLNYIDFHVIQFEDHILSFHQEV
jgi:hypothetical protein